MTTERIYEVMFEFLNSSHLVELENSILPKLFGPLGRKSSLSVVIPTPIRRSHIAKMICRSRKIYNETFGVSSNNREKLTTEYSRISEARQKIYKFQEGRLSGESVLYGSQELNSNQNQATSVESNNRTEKLTKKISDAQHKLINNKFEENNLSKEIVVSGNSESNSKQYQVTYVENQNQNETTTNSKIPKAQHKLINKLQEGRLPGEIVLSGSEESNSKQYQEESVENNKKNEKLSTKYSKISDTQHKLINKFQESNLSEEIVLSGSQESNSNQNQATSVESNKGNEKLTTIISETQHKLINKFQQSNLSEEIVLSGDSESNSKQFHVATVENQNQNEITTNSKISEVEHKLINKFEKHHLSNEKLNSNQKMNSHNVHCSEKIIPQQEDNCIPSRINNYLNHIPHESPNTESQETVLAFPINPIKELNFSLAPIIENNEDRLSNSQENNINPIPCRKNKINVISSSNITDTNDYEIITLTDNDEMQINNGIELSNKTKKLKETKKTTDKGNNSDSSQEEMYLMSYINKQQSQSESESEFLNETNINIKNPNNNDKNQTKLKNKIILKKDNSKEKKESHAKKNNLNKISETKTLKMTNDIVSSAEKHVLKIIETDWNSEKSDSFIKTDHPNIFTKKSNEKTPIIIEKNKQTEKVSSGKRKLFPKNYEFIDEFESPIIEDDKIMEREAPCLDKSPQKNVSLSKRDTIINNNNIDRREVPCPNKTPQKNLTISKKDISNNIKNKVEKDMKETPHTSTLRSKAIPEKRNLSTENSTNSDNFAEINSSPALFQSLKCKKKTKRPLKIRKIAKTKSIKITTTEDIYDFQTSPSEAELNKYPSWPENHSRKKIAQTKTVKHRNISEKLFDKYMGDNKSTPSSDLKCMLPAPKKRIRHQINDSDDKIKKHIFQNEHNYASHHPKINTPIENKFSDSDSDNKFISLGKKNISCRKYETNVERVSKNRNKELERKKKKSNSSLKLNNLISSRETTENEISEKSENEGKNKKVAQSKKKKEEIKDNITNSKKNRKSNIRKQNEQLSFSELNKKLLQASKEKQKNKGEISPLPQTSSFNRVDENVEYDCSNDIERPISNVSKNDRFYETSISNVSKNETSLKQNTSRFYQTPILHHDYNKLNTESSNGKSSRFHESFLPNSRENIFDNSVNNVVRAPYKNEDDNKALVEINNSNNNQDQSLEILNSKTPIITSKKIEIKDSIEIINKRKKILELKKKQNYYEKYIREDHKKPREIMQKEISERYIQRFDKKEKPKENKESDLDSSGFTSRFSNINNSIYLNGSNKKQENIPTLSNNKKLFLKEKVNSTNKNSSRYNSPNEDHLHEPSTPTSNNRIRKRSLTQSSHVNDLIDYGGGGDYTGNVESFQEIPSKKFKYFKNSGNLESGGQQVVSGGGDVDKNGNFETVTSTIEYMQCQLTKIFTYHVSEVTGRNARYLIFLFLY